MGLRIKFASTLLILNLIIFGFNTIAVFKWKSVIAELNKESSNSRVVNMHPLSLSHSTRQKNENSPRMYRVVVILNTKSD